MLVQAELAPIRAAQKRMRAEDTEGVYEILKKGSEEAAQESSCTRLCSDVRHAMQIDYFEDPEFLSEQIKKYK